MKKVPQASGHRNQPQLSRTNTMDTLFFLPDWFDTSMLIKVAILGVSAWLLYWLITVFYLQTLYRQSDYPRDLDIARARFWSILWTLFIMQLFALITLNWNLGLRGQEAVEDLMFFFRFAPEFFVTVTLIVALFAVRSSIKDAIALED